MKRTTALAASSKPAQMSDLQRAAAEARERFLDLASSLRPEPHRYCARMTGSVFDGEDVVQDTLAKLSWQGDGIAQIRDFRYVPYIAGNAIFTT